MDNDEDRHQTNLQKIDISKRMRLGYGPFNLWLISSSTPR